MEHDTSKIDLLAVAIPQECLEIIVSYLGLLELVNLYETSKFFSSLLATSNWQRSVEQFFSQRDSHNLTTISRKIDWRIMVNILLLIKIFETDRMPQAKRVCRVTDWCTSLQYEVSKPDSDSPAEHWLAALPRVYRELYGTLNVDKSNPIIAISNEHVVFMQSDPDSPLMLARVFRIQGTGCELVKSIKRCTAYYWHKGLNILVLSKQKSVIQMNMKDAKQEYTRLPGLPSIWKKGFYGDNGKKMYIKDVREVTINGQLKLVATIQLENVVVFIDLTKKEVFSSGRNIDRAHWLTGSKVAVLMKNSLFVIDVAEKDKHKRTVAANIRHTTPILDFVPNKNGPEILFATLNNKCLEIKVCIWPLGTFVDLNIRIPVTVVPTLDMSLNTQENTIIINNQLRFKLSNWLE